MYRRVIRIGEKSIGITLPKQWLESLNIGLGDLVEVKAIEDMLVIRPVVAEHGGSASVNLSIEDGADEAMRMIIASYIEGFDDITVNGNKDSIRRAYQAIEHKLPGSLILEGEGGVTVKVATSETSIDLKTIINSMSTILTAMFDKLIMYLETNDPSSLEELLTMDDQIDKLYFLALRTIKKLSFRDPKESIDDTIIVKNIEHIADSLDRTARTLKAMGKLEPACYNVLKERTKDIWMYSLRAISSYQESSRDHALKVIMGREDMLNKMFTLVKTPCSEELAGIMHEYQLIVALAVDIAEATFSSIVRSSIKRAKPSGVGESIKVGEEAE